MDDSFVQKLEVDTIAYIEDNNPSSNNRNDISRGDLLLGIFQKDTSRQTFDFAKEVEKDPLSVRKEMQCYQSKVDVTSKIFQYKDFREKSHGSMKVRFDKEVKLIRIFPGPAGLIPDVRNDHVSAASYLSSVKELENKTVTKRIEIKSQDEKNLVGEKAWKFLLNDLPNNFLQDYGISTVKNKANASHCDSTKVRFIAGVLDYVDHSQDDPFVIIKDSTGSIEGTIHRDIPLTYPGILEPNVIIFLHDVGLLKTTTYIITNKYHVLVSLVNLLAIYSDKGRIVSTPLMESVLSHASNVELNRNNYTAVSKSIFISELQKINESRDASLQTNISIDTFTKTYESELAKDPLLYSINGKNENYGEAFKKKTCTVTDNILEHFNYSMDTDDLNRDVFFTTDYDFITSEEQNCLNRSLSKSVSQTSKIQQCDLQVQNTKHLENTKKESIINFQKQIKEQHLPQTLQKCVTDIKTCFSSYDDTICRDSNSNIKFTLLPAIKRNVENSKTLVSYFINDKYDEYDSDDEILSQLDVDNIFDKAKVDC